MRAFLSGAVPRVALRRPLSSSHPISLAPGSKNPHDHRRALVAGPCICCLSPRLCRLSGARLLFCAARRLGPERTTGRPRPRGCSAPIVAPPAARVPSSPYLVGACVWSVGGGSPWGGARNGGGGAGGASGESPRPRAPRLTGGLLILYCVLSRLPHKKSVEPFEAALGLARAEREAEIPTSGCYFLLTCLLAPLVGRFVNRASTTLSNNRPLPAVGWPAF